jgi:RecQ family ATP-dependent DNA helicase
MASIHSSAVSEQASSPNVPSPSNPTELSVSGNSSAAILPTDWYLELRRYWGYDALRPLQAEAMTRVLSGRDSLVVLPTGGGKSLCFQLPAVCQEGMALVVSPLISLMKDQVDSLRACGVPAAFINSSLSTEERRRVAEQVERRELKLLYVAPERLLNGRTLDFLQTAGISLIAIDEAHCISSWGHDFRPEYRGLSVLKERFPDLGVHAYTATATPRVRQDIARQLSLVDPVHLVGNFDRPNLTYRVYAAQQRFGPVCQVLTRHRDESGIVYCISRKEVEQMAGGLRELGIRAAPYHAGLPDAERKRNQDAFLRGEVSVIVATVAFGMGIDKPNVRFVIHARMPKSLEHYQQESGRAGRDGLDSECVLFFSRGDFFTWRKMLESDSREALHTAMQSLQSMLNFCEKATCRHAGLLRYFGQKPDRTNCGACDVCLGELSSSIRGGDAPHLAGTFHRPVAPGAVSSSAPQIEINDPDIVRLQNAANASGLTLSAVPALQMFREGVSIAEVARRMNRAESTVVTYLLAYIGLDSVTDWSRWVRPEVGRRIEEALQHRPHERFKPIFEYLRGEVDYGSIRIVSACLANRTKCHQEKST